MKEIHRPIDFKDLKSLKKPFECPNLLVLSEDVQYITQNLDYEQIRSPYRKGELVCISSLSSTNGYCKFPNKFILNEESMLETKCGWDSSKVKFRGESYEPKE